VDNPAAEVAEILDKTLLQPGQVPLNIMRTLAVHPPLLKRFNGFAGLFISHGQLPPRDRELLILRTAARTSCAYQWHQHVPIGLAAGLSDVEVAALESTDQAHPWPHGDRTLLAIADELLAGDDICDGTWDRARGAWTEAQLVEMVMLVGCYRMIAGFLRSLRVEIE
jgi:AhpD family alkylhydroperoxidase